MTQASLRTLPFDITDPIAFLTNIPGLIGYYPAGEILVFGSTWEVVAGPESVTEHLRPGPLLVRPLCGDESLVDHLIDVAVTLSREGHNRVDIFVVEDGWGGAMGVAPDKETLDDIFHPHDISVAGYYGVQELYQGELVTDRDGNAIGEVGCVSVSPSALEYTRAGETIAPSIDEVLDRFAEDTVPRRELAARALQLARADVRRPTRLRLGKHNQTLAVFFTEWQELIDEIRSGTRSLDQVFDDEASLRVIARCLDNVILRDMTLTALADDTADTARDVWLQCARVFAGTARANALACYALDRFHAGMSLIAQAALFVAMETDPEHSLTRLLEQALFAHIMGDALQTMVETAESVVDSVFDHRDAA
ncbi:DUF4192 domain-containing protein [Corynebacterium sp. H113]|uniref:DUF4192 domain-containing protein n=1 Tax=Corynebacterium sp. H113 TaxID=3133419 RepID=UPI0030B4F83F